MSKKKGLTYLINKLKESDSEDLNYTHTDFIEHLREGTITEPEKIGDLISAYKARIIRSSPNFGLEKARYIAYMNVAGYAVFADYELVSNEHLEPLEKFLNNVSAYGPALKALASYIGIEGEDLAGFIVDKDIFN